MIPRRPDQSSSGFDDGWGDIPAAGPFPKWFGGVIVPLALGSYGLSCLIAGHGTVNGRGITMDLYGTNAAALGIAGLSIASFLHCHFFWGNVYHLSAFAVLGKIFSLIAFIGSVGCLIVRVGVLGKQ